MSALASRPRVGQMVVPFVVDEARSPIDFKELDMARVTACAERGLCGVCGGRIRRGSVAFLGPDDGRSCFADPWMHPDCAAVAAEQCPFVAGRKGWRDGGNPVVASYAERMVLRLAHNWRAHRDDHGRWHFEAVA